MHSKIKTAASLFIALIAVFCQSASFAQLASQNQTVSVSDVTLQLPIPVGFTNPSDSAPTLRALAEKLTGPDVRLLAVFVAWSDAKTTQSGNVPSLNRYFMAQVNRGLEKYTVDKNDFAAFKTQFTAKLSVDGRRQLPIEMQQYIKSTSQKLGTALGKESGHPQGAFNAGQLRQLGVFNETDVSFSTLNEMDAEATDGAQKLTQPIGLATSYVLLKGKIILFTAYTKLDNDADLVWLRTQSEFWTQSALMGNL